MDDRRHHAKGHHVEHAHRAHRGKRLGQLCGSPQTGGIDWKIGADLAHFSFFLGLNWELRISWSKSHDMPWWWESPTSWAPRNTVMVFLLIWTVFTRERSHPGGMPVLLVGARSHVPAFGSYRANLSSAREARMVRRDPNLCRATGERSHWSSSSTAKPVMFVINLNSIAVYLFCGEWWYQKKNLDVSSSSAVLTNIRNAANAVVSWIW